MQQRASRAIVDRRAIYFSNADEFECGFLHLAYEFASLRIVDMLLAAGLKSTSDYRSAPPWYYAAGNSDENVMAHLIASGIDVNAANSDGFTLAHRAARVNKNENVLAMLIAAGADLTTRDIGGGTICHSATANSNAAVMAMLIPLCDVNAVNNDGDTPCISAVIRRNPFALELLIAAGANANAINNNGHSAFDFALVNHDDRVVELLVDANVDIDLGEGTTSMHVAALRGNHRLLGKLFAAGGDVNARRDDQATPCHLICHECDSDGVLLDDATAEKAFQSLSLLLAAKADVHAKDTHGDTPLHSAVESGFCKERFVVTL